MISIFSIKSFIYFFYKDNLEDINALMIASSTINNHKRRLSAAESKRKRIRKEYTANLSLLIPEDVQEERDNLNS